MLVYIIDAFNLVHKVPELKNSQTPHIDLIRYIKKNKLTGSINNKVIVVFDGQSRPEVIGSEFEVFFSGYGTADDIIKKIVSNLKNKSETVVVSDDREIRDFVKIAGAKSCRIDNFIRLRIKVINKEKNEGNKKEIDSLLQREITEEMRKIWLKE
ncbi:MAG: NYN domain-containing protein [Candidatus Omnitrophica bacterium]|nr:NYN domain-containing protein [Candidatus Omnitrophota bacterium]